jgi:hypothetical protein
MGSLPISTQPRAQGAQLFAIRPKPKKKRRVIEARRAAELAIGAAIWRIVRAEIRRAVRR